MQAAASVLVTESFTVPEGDLVVQARGGDAAAQEELARRFRRPAFAFALQLLGNREDALDVAQDSLLKFLTTLDRFDERRAVQPWLFRIVRNRAYDLKRRQRVRLAESLDELIDEGMSPPAATEPPSARLERRQLRKRLWTALGRLSEQQREILVLRDYQDLSYAEMAEILGVPLGTVMSRLHRARKSLREILRDEKSQGEPDDR